MAISFFDTFNFLRELISDKDKLVKFKEIVNDVKELVTDIKDVIQLLKA